MHFRTVRGIIVRRGKPSTHAEVTVHVGAGAAAKDPEFRHRGRGISPSWRQAAAHAAVQTARRWAVPGAHRDARRRLDRERPHAQPCAPRMVRQQRHRRCRARFPPGAERLSELADRHQLRRPLREGECGKAEDAARARRHHRLLERRPSGDADGDAPERSDATPRSRCRPARPQSMRACAAQ